MRSTNLFNSHRPMPSPITGTSTAGALRTAGALIDIQDVYQRLLDKMVFHTGQIGDRKAANAYRRTLKSQPALNILSLIWKEDDLVSEQDLEVAGIGRIREGGEPLNCHRLAINIAEDAGDLERQQKRIQTVVAAAEAYGLIVRQNGQNFRGRPLRATLSLHKLMLAFSDAVLPICAEITEQLAENEDS